jgi:hypothetical protein
MCGRGCVNCGDMKCEYIGHNERCPKEIKCYACGEYGHIGRDCDVHSVVVRFSGPDLANWEYIARVAQAHGWTMRRAGASLRGYDENNKTLFLLNREGVKIDIYTGTMTVKTTLNHPVRGPNQMFRPPGYHNEKKLVEILQDPRVHSGVGFRSEAQGTWLCRDCPADDCRRERGEFTKSQWRNRSKSRGMKIVCRACQAKSPSRLNLIPLPSAIALRG